MWYQLIDKVKEKLEPIAAVFQYNETGAKKVLSKYTRSIQGDMLIDDHDDDESVYDFLWTKFVRSNIWELINMMNIAKCYLVERPHNLCIISKQIVTSLEKIENKLPLAQAFDWLIDWLMNYWYLLSNRTVSRLWWWIDRQKDPEWSETGRSIQQMIDRLELNRLRLLRDTHTLSIPLFLSFYVMDSDCM